MANSSAIAELSSWQECTKNNPLNRMFKKKPRPQTDIDDGEGFGHRVESSNSPSSSSSPSIARYGHTHDIVRAYLETTRGEHGSKEQRAQLQHIVQTLLDSRDCMDIAALAFLATLDNGIITREMHNQISILIQSRMQSPDLYSDHERRLDDLYAKFIGDAFQFRRSPMREPISVLDADGFAHKWLSRSSRYQPAFAFHWDIPFLDLVANDSLSEAFDIHGVKCRLRFRKAFVLSNGETWTGVWLHNVSSGCRVVTVKYALVVSNIAYPTVLRAEVIKPSKGIRPSQGIGAKLFAKLDELAAKEDGGQHAIIESDSVRISVVYQ
ncbi:hypothetical protein GGI03_006869 [Coemansia sp. RSA 2337]|nr:hypothetical protein GGI08_005752 [Coemansia sp. S2]KAJ2050912.1 hypothetical protein H4S04_002317 [Coemansia sp. S16]KAJ2451475.1 hypothetical protein GGI03_006869 [Coemansia sp. RSA 2337]